MSNVKIKANTSGSADFTIEAPATDSALTLTLPSVDGELLTTNGDASGLQNVESAFNTQIGGRRNLIINGAMQVAQRGTSVSGITGAGYYTCDRWDWYSNCEETITQSQSTDAPDGFSNSLKVEVTTAETSVTSIENSRIQYGIEGQDLQHLAYGTSTAKSLTISFWVKSSVTGNYSCSLQHIDASVYYADVYTISSANTWEYKTITVPGYTSTAIANDNTEGMRINFGLTSGTDYTSGSTQTWGDSTRLHSGLTVDVVSTNGATWQITGVQLEVGTVATPFEHRSYGEELALCMRYYINYGSTRFRAKQYNATTREVELSFPVSMRTTPTITKTDNGGTFAFSGNASNLFRGLYVSLGYNSSTVGFLDNVTADAEL